MLVVSLMIYGAGPAEHMVGILMPITVLSVFVLSAAVMGYVFLYQPILLFLAGEQKSGVTLFLHTVASFACIVAVLMVTMFFIARP